MIKINAYRREFSLKLLKAAVQQLLLGIGVLAVCTSSDHTRAYSSSGIEINA